MGHYGTLGYGQVQVRVSVLTLLGGSNKSEKVRDWAVETHWIRFGETSRILTTTCVLIDSL